MPETIFSYRMLAPLYGLQDAEFVLQGVAGFAEARVRLTIVDSGVPRAVSILADRGGGVIIPGDNGGFLHSTRFDVTTEGLLAGFDPELAARLTVVTNRVIDWYRLHADRPTVRRIARITGYEAQDSSGQHATALHPVGVVPGERSDSAGASDGALEARIAGDIRRALPLWVALYLDAAAEFNTGNLATAVLIANAAMETLIQRGFRMVAPDAEVLQAFPEEQVVAGPPRGLLVSLLASMRALIGRAFPVRVADDTARPWSFWRLLSGLNRLVDTGRSTRDLKLLAERVNAQRNAVTHGNDVRLTLESVGDAVRALRELGGILDPAIVACLLARAGVEGAHHAASRQATV